GGSVKKRSRSSQSNGSSPLTWRLARSLLEHQRVVPEDQRRADLDPGHVLLREDVEVPLEDGGARHFIGPPLLDLLEELLTDFRVGRILFLEEERIPSLVREEDALAGRGIGLGESGGIVVRVDVIGIPAEEIGGHLLLVELLLI